MILKPFLYVVAAILVSSSVYLFIHYVPISYERVPQELSADVDGPLKKAIDENSTIFCEIESFWAQYDFWGDTDTVYDSAGSEKNLESKVEESINCDEPSLDDKAGA